MNEIIKKEKDLLTFYCPGCKQNHFIDKRWTFNNDYENPTFSPSLRVSFKRPDNREWICHSFIKNGYIEFCSDCSHKLSNQKIKLELHEIVYVSNIPFEALD